MNYEYGIIVKIKEHAPKNYRPGEFAEIVGITIIDSDILSESYGLPIDTVVLYLEYLDGSSTEVPDKYIEIDN